MRPNSLRARQRGAVLLTTVMLLVLLTVLALTAVSMNRIQTRMAANSADYQVAYHTAEGALNQATNNLLAGTYPPSGFTANANGLYVFDPTSAPVWTVANTWSSSTGALTGFQGGSNASSQYVIEKLPAIVKPGQNMKTPTQVFRVTARAVGKSGHSPVVLQTTVQVQ